MAFRVRGTPQGPGTPKATGKPDQTSALGPGGSALPDVGNAPKPMRSRRDYGKTKPPAGSPQPNPFGPTYRGM
jgi:hypothetical protein